MLIPIPDVLTTAELQEVRALAEQAEHEFADGRRSAGRQAREVKQNQELPRTSEARGRIQAVVLAALNRNYRFRVSAWPKRILDPFVSRYHPGMTYGDHVDEWTMTGSAGRLRTDVSLTLFLSDPAEYDGGELVISSSYGTEAVKLPAGSAITYPSNTLHRVEPVTRGTRLVVVTWIESQLRDPGQREMMYDLQNLSARLVRADANGENAQVASKTFSTLMRMWAEH